MRCENCRFWSERLAQSIGGLAETCIKSIPALMSRMSNRCIRISQAVNTIIKAEKLHEEYKRIKEMPGKPG